jgi:hypothetical protein
MLTNLAASPSPPLLAACTAEARGGGVLMPSGLSFGLSSGLSSGDGAAGGAEGAAEAAAGFTRTGRRRGAASRPHRLIG